MANKKTSPQQPIQQPLFTPEWNENAAVVLSGVSTRNKKMRAVKDRFHDPDKSGVVNPAGWSKYYPYSLLILDHNNAEFKQFVLPIPPQELMIGTPFAIQPTITVGGYVEEHNGTQIKMIQLSGTTGVLPLGNRETSQAPAGTPVLGGAFQNVIQSAGALKSAWGGLVGTPQSPNLISDAETLTGSGYYKFLELREFLEGYVALKRNNLSKGYKLGLAIWKEESVYLVTPVMFNVRRSVSSPLEYMYDLQFRSYGRLHKSQIGPSKDTAVVSKTGSIAALQTGLNKLRAARKVLTNASNVVRAARADIAGVMEYARQGILACKDAVGVAQTAADLPAQIINDIGRAIIPNLESLIAACKKAKDSYENIDSSVVDALNQFGTIAGPSAADDLFKDPAYVPSFWEYVDPNELKMPKTFYEEIQRQTDEARATTPSEWSRRYSVARQAVLSMSNALGAGDTTTNSVYGITDAIVDRTPTASEFVLLNALEDAAEGFAILAGGGALNNKLTTVEYVAGYAAASGVAFQTPVSKFSVPFIYGTTLEQLAASYLGDPNRWIEIAALNGLREPYIDEVGFTTALLANGKLATINVASVENLRTSQAIWLQSDTIPPDKRHILGVKQLGAGSYELTLDGDPDLAKFLLSDNAFLRAFLPDTVNSMQVIYIPSDEVGATTEDLTSIPGIDAFDNLLQVGGIDVQLTQDNDLVISNTGDFVFSYGMNNIVQKVRLALATPKGSLLQHPSFGLPVTVGSSIADTSAKEISENIKTMFSGDPAFNGIGGISVLTQGPTTQINVNVSVYGLERPLDIAVQVVR